MVCSHFEPVFFPLNVYDHSAYALDLFVETGRRTAEKPQRLLGRTLFHFKSRRTQALPDLLPLFKAGRVKRLAHGFDECRILFERLGDPF